MDDTFVAVGAPDGPLAEDRVYSMVELVEMPAIAMEKGASVRELLDGAYQRFDTALTPRFEVALLATVADPCVPFLVGLRPAYAAEPR